MIHPNTPRHIADAADAAAKRAAFAHWFGLSWSEAKVLYALVERAGDFLSGCQLGQIANINDSHLPVRIHRLRLVMNTEAIDFVRGHGYRLTDIGLAETKEAMEAMARSLVA